MKLGIGTYTFMWSIGFAGAEPARRMSALDLLAKARELCVGVVQYGPNLGLDSLSEGDLSTLAARARDWGISIEMGTQGLDSGRLREQLAIATRVGCALLRTTAEGTDGVNPGIDQMRLGIEGIVPDLARQGVCLAIENSRIPARTLAELVESVGSEQVGITLDTVNSLAVPEGTEEVTEALLRDVKSVHVKDFAVERLWHRMGFSVEGRPAGRGQLNVPGLLERVGRVHPEANAILELWTPEQHSLSATIELENAWAEESIVYLRHLISE